MSTPEKKVKDKVKKVLAEHGAYYFMPATHGYGSSGVPDIVACLRGKFIGIECKANKGKPTALQLKNLRELSLSGGLAVLIDERGIDQLGLLLTAVNKFDEGTFINLFAALLEVSRKSAIQRMARLVKKNQAIKLNMPTVGNPARFKLLVSKESLLHTQKFAGPKMNRQVDWKKFCSDPFGMAKKEVTE
jgi:hypothetical protein